MRITAEELVEKAKQHIEYTKDKKNRIATLTFNRPKQFNATTVGMRLLYGDLIHRANIDDEVKVLVVRGAISDLLSPDGVATMKRIKPDMAFVEIPNVGHAPTLEEPQAEQAIVAFLAKVE